MPIDTRHPAMLTNTWQTCRDVLAGEEALQAKPTRYIPVLEGLSENDSAYRAYCNRATFYPASKRTVIGLTGLVLRKPSAVVARKDQDLDDLSGNGWGLVDASCWALTEALGLGRGGLLLDWNDELGHPVWTPYCAEHITNWFVEPINGVPTASVVVLKEDVQKPKTNDPYEYETVCQYRELQLLTVTATGDRVVGVRVWKEAVLDGKKTYFAGPWAFPFRRGELLANRLPFIFIGSMAPTPDVQDPPLYDLFRLNLSHYRTSADHEHALHFVALPTPWVTGWGGPAVVPNAAAVALATGVPVPNPQAGLKIGSGAAWCIPNELAKVGMLEFTGQGLQSIEKALERKEAQMSIVGSRLLEGQSQRAETAEAVRIRRSGEGATLSSVTRAVSLALTDALRYDAWWRGTDRDAALRLSVTLNQDYLEMGLDAQTITALVAAWQAGGISAQTLYWNFQQGEIARPNVTFDEEKELIKAEEPEPLDPNSTGLDPNAPPIAPAPAPAGPPAKPADKAA